MNDLRLTARLDSASLPEGALNDLLYLAGQYRSGPEFADLLRFLVRFKTYSPYNGTMIQAQRPGAKYVAPPRRWFEQYRRTIRPGALPIVILKPMGPVMFVYDVSDTIPLPNAPPLPKEVTDPFAVRGSFDVSILQSTLENCTRDAVRVEEVRLGSQQGGSIRTTFTDRTVSFKHGFFRRQTLVLPEKYLLQLMAQTTPAEQYATVVHELAHLYCGHLGSSDLGHWPHRLNLSQEVMECEAESISYLVCRSLGLETRSEVYISGYLQKSQTLPEIDLDRMIKVTSEIQEMGRKRLPPRKLSKS